MILLVCALAIIKRHYFSPYKTNPTFTANHLHLEDKQVAVSIMSQPVMQTGRAFSRFKLPGFNLPLNFTPGAGRGEGKNLFRTALNTLDAYGDGKSSHVP